jgi:hypothetical protein
VGRGGTGSAPGAVHQRHDVRGFLVRAAACLVPLYAQPLSPTVRLTTEDLVELDGEPHIRLVEAHRVA